MDICNQWQTFVNNSFCIQLPIMVIMGDMPFLNKLVHFRAGISLQSHVCCLYHIILDICDDPYKPFKHTSLFGLIQDIQNNPNSLKQAGYYSLKNNIFYLMHSFVIVV